MIKGQKFGVNLKQSINADTYNYDVKPFSPEATALEGNFIERKGGLTNNNILEEAHAIPGDTYYTDEGQRLTVDSSGFFYVNDNLIGQVNPTGVGTKSEINGKNDTILLDTGYVTSQLVGNSIIVTEYNDSDVQTATRTVTFTNLTPLLPFITSLSMVRRSDYTYLGNQYWALRIGDQVSFLDESDPGVSIGRFVQNFDLLGGNAVYASTVHNGVLYFGGQAGRVGSYDGTGWKDYLGNGTGSGGYNSGTVLGTNDINTMASFNGWLVVAGAGGRVGSYDGAGWKDYLGAGTGAGFSDNGTLIGTNAINACAVWKEFLVFGGVGGRVGCTNGTTKYVYTVAVTLYPGRAYPPPTSNALVLGAVEITAMATFDNILTIGGASGRIGSFDGGWIRYDGTLDPTAANSVAAWGQASGEIIPNGIEIIVKGAGVWLGYPKFLDSNTNYYRSVDSGVTWTTHAYPGNKSSIVYLSGNFYINGSPNYYVSSDGIAWTSTIAAPNTGDFNVANGYIYSIPRSGGNPSVTTTGYRSSDGINWTSFTIPAGWYGTESLGSIPTVNVVYNGTNYVATCYGFGSGTSVMSSSDGTTWTVRTANARALRCIVFGTTFVLMTHNSATTTSIYTSPDGATWTARTTPAAASSWVSMVTDGTTIVILNQSTSTTQAIARSTNATTWTASTNNAPDAAFSAVIYTTYLRLLTAGTDIFRPQYYNTTSVDFNGTLVSTDTVSALYPDGTRILVGSSGGKVAESTNAGVGTSLSTTVIGTARVYGISKIGDTVVVGGAGGLLGSYDGTNWKDYDGTGTGTGPYINAAIASDIRSIVAYNGLFFLGYALGYANSVDTEGAYSVVNVNTAVGVNNLNYLYAYRYENASFLWHVVNGANNLVWYSANPFLTNPTSLKGRYAWPQVSGGKTRHIITETPRGDASNIYVFSTHGYTDFTNFSATQVYPASGLNVSSVLTGLIGWNYGECTYKVSGSATNIFNLYGPIPKTDQSTGFYQLTQGNVDNLIQGYSKLSTGAEEFRLGIIGTAQSYISVAINDGAGRDNAGVMLTGVGEFDDSYTPQVGTKRILYRWAGRFVIVRLSDTPANRIQKISERLYKVNTISPLNLVNSTLERLEVSSIDYNGRVVWNFSGTAATVNSQIATLYQSNSSNSIDVGVKLVLIPTPGTGNLIPIGTRIPYSANLQGYSIDAYSDGEYIGSYLNDGNVYVQTDPYSPIYVPYTTLPTPQGVPIGAGGAMSDLGRTILLNPNYDGYTIGNDIPGDFVSFILFGQTYLFDGLAVYLVTLTGGVITQYVKVVEAVGLMYIATTPEAAFFLSGFDNSLYSFNGGRNLGKTQRLTALEQVTTGVYNAKENTIFLNSANYFMTIRDGILSQVAKLPTQTGTQLFSTTQGVKIANDDTTWSYHYYPVANSTPVPFLYQTAFFGLTLNDKSYLDEAVFSFYDQAKPAFDCTITTNSFDESTGKTSVAKFAVKTTDYNQFGVAKIRVKPVKPKSLGISFTVQSNQSVFLAEVDLNYLPSEMAGTAKTR